MESATFQTLANSSTDVLSQLEGVGTALVTATTNLNKAWSKHCEDERNYYQDRAFSRRLVIRRTRQVRNLHADACGDTNYFQEIWEEKCRVIDGEDFIQDQEITDRESERKPAESVIKSLVEHAVDSSTVAHPLVQTPSQASTAEEITPAPEAPISSEALSGLGIEMDEVAEDNEAAPGSPIYVEILSEIDVEISRLEAYHEAATADLKAEQRAHASTAAQVLDLQGEIVLLEQTLETTNKELQQLKADSARAATEKRRRKSESCVSEAISNTPNSSGSTVDHSHINEGIFVIGSELNELKAAAEDLRKEKEAHAATAARLAEFQEQYNPFRSFASSGDLKKYMTKLKASKAGRNSIQLQASLEESVKALESEKQEHAATMTKLRDLEEEAKLKDPLVEVGQRVRRKFLENSKRAFFNGSIIDIRGEADLDVIKAGGEAGKINCFRIRIVL